MKHKLFTLFAAICCAICINAQTSGYCGGNLQWSYDTSTNVLTITGSGAMYIFASAPWYQYHSSIQSVSLPDGMTSMGEVAFRGCTGLTSVTIPNSVTSIGRGTFEGCTGLTSVTIGNSVAIIGSSAFEGCTGLTSITIPNSVTSIGSSAFGSCTGLTTVTIPNSVTSIGGSTFSNCTGLTSVTIPNSVTSIGSSAFSYCTGLTSVNISNSVTSIGFAAFRGCTGLTSVTIPNSVTSIGNCIFEGCTGLTSVTIGNSVAIIGSSAFEGCTGLTSVHISDIAAWCAILFNDNSSHTANPLCYAHNLYLNGKLITNLVIPNSVTSIGAYAFNGCSSLVSVTIPNSVTNIGDHAFDECTKLTSVTLNSNTIIGTSSLIYIFGSQVTEYVIGSSVTSIGGYAFENCSRLTSVTIPNTVTSIGSHAFYKCTGLTSVTIPNSVTSIGDGAFWGCSGLTSVTIPNSVTSIGDGAFWDCTSLTSVTIPNSVTSIGGSAFAYCSVLTSVTIPNSVTSIGGSTFSNCTGLTSVTIPNSVTSIGSSAFADCSGLTSVTIPNSVTIIGGSAFSNCTSLSSVEIPNSVTSIGNAAFYWCQSLKSVTIGNSVTSIGHIAFAGCTGLTSIVSYATTPPSLDLRVFSNVVCSNIPLYVPRGSANAYKTADQWKEFIIRSSYTVTFVDWDGTILKTEQVMEGNAATAPANPTRDGYTFTGWDKDFSYVTSDIVVAAQYSERPITVRLNPDLTSYWTKVYLWAWTANGDLFNAWPGVVVNKDENGWYSYTFNEDVTNVNIIWNSGSNQNQTIDITGITASTCYALNSVSGNQITVRTENCPGTTPVTPTYYTVTFKDWDGTVLKSEQVEKGHAATAPANPTRDGYTFAGWDKDFSNVTSDLIVMAQYSQNPVTLTYYTVTFKDWDGTVLKSEQVEKGHAATAPVNPTRDGYTFAGWDKDFSNVTSDLIVTAQYTQNGCGLLVKVKASSYNKATQTDGQYSGTPSAKLSSKEAERSTYEGETGYKLNTSSTYLGIQFDEGQTLREGDTVVVFVTTASEKLQIFSDKCQTLIAETEQVVLGENKIVLDSRANGENGVYVGRALSGAEGTPYNAYVAYIAVYRPCNIYTVTFKDWDGTILKTQQVEGGHAATAPATFKRDCYIFTGWDEDFSNVQSDMIVTAQYQASPTCHFVTFVDWDGTVLSTQQVEEGSAATAPANPTRDGYTFTGWDKDFSNVQSDMTVTALYQPISSSEVCGLLAKVQAKSKNEATMIGVFSGTPSVSLSGSSVYNEETGYKLGNAGQHLGVTFEAGQTLLAGDIVTVFVTVASKKMQLYADKGQTLIAETNRVELGENTFVLGESANGAQGLYVYRGTDSQNCNAYVAYISVKRECVEIDKYSVIFKDWDGTILKFEQVIKGQAATAPANPTRDGYIFTGWDKDFSNITANLVVTAMYQEDNQTGIEEIQPSDTAAPRKILINNVIYILRGDKVYTVTGQKVK